MQTFQKRGEFTVAYIEALLWESHDDSDRSLNENYSEADLAPETFARILADCAAFEAEMSEAIGYSASQAGHDFWLTRVGSGAGFWDGDWPEPQATALTQASKRFGHVDVYVGDDGLIYLTPESAGRCVRGRREGNLR